MSSSNSGTFKLLFLKIKTPRNPLGILEIFFSRASEPRRRKEFLSEAFLATFLEAIKEILGGPPGGAIMNFKRKCLPETVRPSLNTTFRISRGSLFLLGSMITP